MKRDDTGAYIVGNLRFSSEDQAKRYAGAKVYGVGTLAYYDSLYSGLVPCKVTKITPGRTAVVDITAKVTATRYAYKRGETITFSGTHIVPRVQVKRFRGQIYPRILNNYRWEVQSV